MNIPDSPKTENRSELILTTYILDAQIEHPEKVLIVCEGKNTELLSELFARNPDMRQKLIEERTEVFRLLGLEVPNAN